MNLHSALPYSLIKYGLPFDYPRLRSDAKADVVILGGGISAALLAYYLAEEGRECLVIDKRTIGLGSTCASTSLLQYELDIPLFKLIKMRGETHAVRAYKLCRNAIIELQKIADHVGLQDFEPGDSLYFASRRKHLRDLKKEFATRKKYGFDVEWLEPSDLKSDFGFKGHGAILSHHAAQANAYLFAHALFQHAIKKGARVYDDSEIVFIRPEKKNITLKTADGESLTAKNLVFATGYEVTEFIPQKIVQLHSTYAMAGSQLEQFSSFWKNDAMIWNTDNPYLYLRTTSDRRILVGGRDEPFQNPIRRDALLGKKTKQLASDFKTLFPHIPLEVEFSWAGTFGTTQDGLPVIGTYHRLPDCYFSLGFGGNGITFSQVGAKIISDLLAGKTNEDAEIFSFGRF